MKAPLPTDDELALEWRELHSQTAYGLGDFRRYANGMWGMVAESVVEQEILEVLRFAKTRGVKPTARLLSSVKKIASVLAGIEDTRWDTNPNVIVCANGTLEVSSLQLRAHDPLDYQTTGLGFAYDPQALAPTWDYVLNSTIPEAKDFIESFLGYALTTDTRYEIALWLYGPRGSGRSTVLTGMQAVLGARCGILGLADIEHSSFALTNLPGKTLMISTEQPSGFLRSSNILNQIISGELINVERKYRDPVLMYPKAKLAWAMNELPRVSDSSDGLFRRVKVVEFPALRCNADPLVKERIKQEGAGILNKALAGLQRVQARGCFEIPECVKNATTEFQRGNDVPAEFVAECCHTGDAYKVQSAPLYKAYSAWCIDNGHKPMSSTSIAREWRRLGYTVYTSDGKRMYRGIGLISANGRSETLNREIQW